MDIKSLSSGFLSKPCMLSLDKQVLEQIEKANRILITFGRDWKGDNIASALALKIWLESRNKAVEIIAEKPTNSSPFSFLPGYSLITHELNTTRRFIISLNLKNATVDQVEYRLEKQTLDFIVSPKTGFFTAADISSRSSGFHYNLVFVLGTPDLESLGLIYERDTEFFFKTPIINIDHNPANESFGQINIVDVTAVAVTEIIYQYLLNTQATITEDLATCLLTGLITETKSFKTTNITPHALQVASQLVALGGRREEIINALYRSRQLNVLKLWGRVLVNLQERVQGTLVWASITSNDFTDTHTEPAHLADIIDELIINMPKAQLIILLYETKTGTRALLHSVKNLNALELTANFNSQGTRNLASLVMPKPLAEASSLLITQLEEKLKKIET